MKKEIVAIIVSFVLLAGIITVGLLTSKNYEKNGSLEPRQEAQPEEKNEVVILNKEALTESSLRHFDTSNWLTYKGEEGSSFKYPSDNWRVEQWGIYGPGCFNEKRELLEECKDTKLKAKYSISGIHREEPYDVHFILDVWENVEELSLLDWIKKTIIPISFYVCSPLSISDNIDGLACKDTWLDSLPGGAIFYNFYLSHQDLIYIFSPYDIGCVTSDPDFPDCFLKQQQMYATIVSTFSVE